MACILMLPLLTIVADFLRHHHGWLTNRLASRVAQ